MGSSLCALCNVYVIMILKNYECVVGNLQELVYRLVSLACTLSPRLEASLPLTFILKAMLHGDRAICVTTTYY